jgi:hypothetical protein
VIIKKNINKIPFLIEIRKALSKLIFISGVGTILLIISIFGYYYTSGVSDRHNPYTLIKKFDQKILDKHLGFSIFEIDDYINIKLISLKFIFIKNKLENIRIEIDQKNLYKLELQRENKISQTSIEKQNTAVAKLKTNKKKYDIKLRVKGDRLIHFRDKDKTSYKVDIKGDDRIWGLEEFSIQKPITRNYMYEFIFHRLLQTSGLISLKYFFVNLSLNDNKQGIYAIEEGFSKELIERNKKRNGPIFGLNEDYDDYDLIYPNVEYDMYSKEFWTNNYPELTEIALSKLNKLKEKEIKINEIFDVDKWATFFAIIDLSSTYHGSLLKSVKLYYNPVTAKFEPIGFDGHYNPNLFKDFLIYDLIDDENVNCSYLCEFKDWYFVFLKKNDGSINDEFLNLYIKALQRVSSQDFLDEFNKNHDEDINFNNSQLLSDNNKKDLVFYEGLGLYMHDQNFLYKRSKYINSRLNKIVEPKKIKKDLIGKAIQSFDILKNDNIEYQNGEYYLTNDLVIKKNYYLAKNKKLNINDGVKIIFQEDVSFTSEGSIFFNGTKKKPITVFSEGNKGSFVFSDNIYSFKNVIFENLSFPKDNNKILYGGINLVNSNIVIIDTEINNSQSEDAINIISSQSYINNLKINNASADALDIDFGKIVFKNIICQNILNDCLDVSGATVTGDYLQTIDIKDKGLSFGENSKGSISNSSFIKNKLAVAVKDGSHLLLSEFNFKENKYDIAVFNKKKEYGTSTLNLNKLEDKNNLKILLGANNKILPIIDEKIIKVKNSYINDLFY